MTKADTDRIRHGAVGALGLALGLTLGACGFLDNPTPSEATLTLTGESGAEVKVVVSTTFIATRAGPGQPILPQLFEADTLVRSLPFDTTWDIRDGNRFFAEIDTVAAGVPESFRMRVSLDDDQRYDEGGSLRERVFKFLFIFNQAIVSDEDVL